MDYTELCWLNSLNGPIPLPPHTKKKKTGRMIDCAWIGKKWYRPRVLLEAICSSFSFTYTMIHYQRHFMGQIFFTCNFYRVHKQVTLHWMSVCDVLRSSTIVFKFVSFCVLVNDSSFSIFFGIHFFRLFLPFFLVAQFFFELEIIMTKQFKREFDFNVLGQKAERNRNHYRLDETTCSCSARNRKKYYFHIT